MNVLAFDLLDELIDAFHIGMVMMTWHHWDEGAFEHFESLEKLEG